MRWNTMIGICSGYPIDELTPIQRVAQLAFYYMSEVYNGGHHQYFINQRELNHREVVEALKCLGAIEQASVLANAIDALVEKAVKFPDDVEEFLINENDAGLSAFDTQFYKCGRSIEMCLQDYLDKHESEFIEWIS